MREPVSSVKDLGRVRRQAIPPAPFRPQAGAEGEGHQPTIHLRRHQRVVPALQCPRGPYPEGAGRDVVYNPSAVFGP